MFEIEEVHGGRVPTVHHADLQAPEESRQIHPEVVAHQDQGLNPLAVALPQGIFQRAPATGPLPEEPLLELVQHDQDFLRSGRAATLAQLPEKPGDVFMPSKCRKSAVQAAKQSLLRPIDRRLDVNAAHRLGQPRDQPRRTSEDLPLPVGP